MRRVLLVLFGLALIAPAAPGSAAPAAVAPTTAGPGSHRGRPRIVLDQLVLPEQLPGAPAWRRQLASILQREATRADWGAGRGSTITFRFEVRQLELVRRGELMRVRCTAVGRLPRGKHAVGSLTQGGDARRPDELVLRTLEIVARGIITRLAELERRRRGDSR